METQIVMPKPYSGFLAQVEALSGQKIYRCNQCAKCTAGCPAAQDMDFPPRRAMRALQLGLGAELLRSSAIWTCLYCRTCSVRCPMEIDVDRVLEAVRLLAVAQGQPSLEARVVGFHRIFLRLLRWGGRIYDLGLGGWFNLSTGRPWANMGLFVALVSKGRMSFRPLKVKASREVRAIFARVKGMEATPPSAS
ncbi:MAG: 4Fe-4S dicluster domain-containing protein [Chloroflexi bacterium]|nr:4Fe-4S dicluster domain-containing protein [Chloroflexota bacterium]